MLEKLKKISTETKIIAILIGISAIAHGYNMFHFPYYENDEGVYMSQAWSILKMGKLAPYTYWYDHAPFGWVLIAFWVLLTGGFFTFGFSVNSGRVLMLILHLLSVFFLFKITKYISKSNLASIIAVLFFSLSPLGLYYQRRVLLDNIMSFWFLGSVFFLARNKIKLRHVILSGLAFGIAILSKENAIFFIPAMIFFLFLKTHFSHKTIAIGLWIFIVCSLVSSYFLLAILKGEFFPQGTLLGGTASHVSLLNSFNAQLSRGTNASFTDLKHNLFWIQFFGWIDNDAVIIILGCISTVINLIVGFWKRSLLFPALLSILFWLFLIRGGVVLEFYILPLLPILAINIGIALEKVFSVLKFLPNLNAYYSAYIIGIAVICLWYLQKGGVIFHENLFTSDQTTPQIQAVDWIKKNSDPGSFVVIDNYGYIEMHDSTLPKGNYKYAEWYWKVAEDPQIEKILDNDPSNISYIGQTKQMQSDVQISGLKLVGDSLRHASVIKIFYKDNWGLTFWATHYPKQVLSLSWNSYKQNFIDQDGATKDPYSMYATTSEAESYAMLRSVWTNDKKQFDKTWQWTKTNLQKKNNLFAWYAIKKDNSLTNIKMDSATDADEDIAFSLLLAYGEWNNSQYLKDAKKIIPSIWNYEVKEIAGRPYLLAGDWAKVKSGTIIDPSYLAPYEYRIFAQVDPKHNWKALVDSSYFALNVCSNSNLDTSSSVGLPPNWCNITDNGIAIADTSIGDSNYSYDAFRVPWRLAVDYLWFGEPRAKEFANSHPFIVNLWKANKTVLVGYTHDGKVNQNYESAGAYGANLGYFILTDSKMAGDVYDTKILPKFYTNANSSYWEDPKNYYVQNWAWFGTALYYGKLQNFWNERKDKFADILTQTE